MTKRPNTLKMQRLLESLVECKLRDRKVINELQEDARRVLGVPETTKPKARARR